jgi:hypothetical protein
MILLVAPVALGQPAGGRTNAAPPAPAYPAPAAPGQVQPLPAPAPVPAQYAPPAPQKMTITGPQMLEQGREYRKGIQAIQLEIKEQTQQAKNDKDVIRLNCLLDKLMKVDANAQTMDQTLLTLQDMVTRQDENGQLHAYTRITIINELVKVLKTEADACVGAETSYVGPTKVVTEKPPLPEGVDQPSSPVPPFSVIDRPVAASRSSQ